MGATDLVVGVDVREHDLQIGAALTQKAPHAADTSATQVGEDGVGEARVRCVGCSHGGMITPLKGGVEVRDQCLVGVHAWAPVAVGLVVTASRGGR